MYVLNNSEKRYIEIFSNEKLNINEYLKINDEFNGNLMCEIIDINGYFKITEDIKMKLKSKDEFYENIYYIAKCKVLEDIDSPITPGSNVFKPTFKEIEKYILNGKVEDSFHLGVVRGTEEINIDIPIQLKNICPFWNKGKAVKQEGIPFILDYRKLREYPHIGLFGTSGSGKTFGLRVLCEELMKKNIPALCFDPHYELNFGNYMDELDEKFKYNFSNDNEIFVIGKNIGINFHELELGELVHLFNYVDSLSEPQKSALEVLYSKGDTIANLKNKIVNLKIAFENEEKSKKDRYELSSEQILLFNKHKNRISGSKSLQALGWKLDSLENTNIFNGNLIAVENCIKEGKLAIIRGDINRLKMMSSHIISKLYYKRKKYCDGISEGLSENEFFPMFFTILDEAHNFCPKDGNSPTRNILKVIAQEARKYGVFEILCTQKPGTIDQTIFAQLNTKIIYRINTSEDMETISKETNLTEEQTKAMPDLASGHCYIASAILNKTYSVRFRTTFTKSPHSNDPFNELKKNIETKDKMFEFLKIKLPFVLADIRNFHSELNIEMNRHVDISEIVECLDKMIKKGEVSTKKNMFGIEYILNKI